MIKKYKNQYLIGSKYDYEMGSLNLNYEDHNTYIKEIIKIIRENITYKVCSIYFHIQNEEVIIRNVNNLKCRRPKEIIQLIKYEIGEYMPLNLHNYVIKYKKIINTKGEGTIQGILFPKKYVDICKCISEKLKIKKKYLYINFDVLQKLIDLRTIDLPQDDEDKTIIIENREKDMILNEIVSRRITESYVVEKSNNQYFINQISCKNIYYYGKEDDFINEMSIKRLDINNKLILDHDGEILDMTVDNLIAWGMII